ncbi:MAG: VOC family protein [Thaumarchaeota archaeon]|nr:VOC family protein [Nitrososphaerota archaeon]
MTEEPPKTKKRSSRKKPKAVSAIPKGYHTVTPYLVVSNGSGAIEFYKKAFGAKEVQTHKTPDGKILNAQLKIGDSMVMLSDEFPGADTRSPLSLGTSTVTLHIYTEDVDKLWNRATTAGALIMMPLNNQFWGERYGQLADPFGHRWSLSQQVRMSEEEMEALEKASMEMMAQGEHPGRPEEPPTGVA